MFNATEADFTSTPFSSTVGIKLPVVSTVYVNVLMPLGSVHLATSVSGSTTTLAPLVVTLNVEYSSVVTSNSIASVVALRSVTTVSSTGTRVVSFAAGILYSVTLSSSIFTFCVARVVVPILTLFTSCFESVNAATYASFL